MKTVIAIVAANVALVSTPAFAQPEGKAGTAKVTYDRESGEYCFSDVVTGSRIAKTDCRSKAEWADAGIQIRHEDKVELARR